MKKYFLLTLCMALTMVLFCGCGSDNNMQTGSETTTQNESNNNSTEENNNIVDDAANAAEDVADGALEGVKDVADGVSDAVSGAFNSFDDASRWFMDQFPNEEGRYEIRNTDKDLTEYSKGRKGYHIELHDTTRSDNTKVGDFYIDSENGKVYRSDEHGKTFAEYDFSDLQ
ncbi:MAG: hypothetical protein J6A82_02325 [Coprococcus sp.]|nr:hypothetical protein [Coprococcus sp.]